jgi:PPOX class probable F420-dependent enzyme
MATVTPDRRPHVIPFVFALVKRGSDRVAYWAVDRKPKRSTDLKRIKNLEQNPAVELVVDHYDDGWDQLWWVRCSGRARVVTSETEREEALRALGEKYPRYGAEPPDGPVVAIDIERIVGWEAESG